VEHVGQTPYHCLGWQNEQQKTKNKKYPMALNSRQSKISNATTNKKHMQA
jgi:hypothetical protein